MASLEALPSDQRAVLELVLRRGRSYDEIGAMLSIDRAGVRARALAALDALGPDAPISDERRHLITDYLLGALPGRVADEVRSMLAQSAAERAWARVVASELGPIAGSALPEIPVEATSPARAAAPAATRPAGAPPRPAPKPRPRATRPSSRAGGRVVLGLGGVLAVAVVVVLVIVLSGGGGNKAAPAANSASRPPTSSSASSGATTAATTAATPSGAQLLGQVNLQPPAGGAAKGIAVLLRVSGRTGVEIRASGLTPNTLHPPNAYAVWLYNSPADSHILGFVNPGVGKNGQLQTAGGLPTNAKRYQKLLITLETQSNPKTPGTIVLAGPLTGLS
jgi:hypothetical protein